MRGVLNLSCVLAVLVFAGSARADSIIAFEGASGFADDIGEFIDVDGFRFTLSDKNSIGFLTVSSQNDIVEAGTTKLFAANRAEITMTKVGGGAFNLLSVDVGGSFIDFTNRWASSVDVSGSGDTVNVAIPSSPASYQNATPNFLGVTSVTFVPFVNAGNGQNDYEYVLDDVRVSTTADAVVPEPGALVLLGLGGLVVGWRRRRAAQRP